MKKNEGWNMQKINITWAKMKQKDKRQFIPTNPRSGGAPFNKLKSTIPASPPQRGNSPTDDWRGNGFNRNALHLMALKGLAYSKEFEQLLNDMSEHDTGMLRLSINQKDDLGNTPLDLVWLHWAHNEDRIHMIDVIQSRGGRASKYAEEVEKLMENRR